MDGSALYQRQDRVHSNGSLNLQLDRFTVRATMRGMVPSSLQALQQVHLGN